MYGPTGSLPATLRRSRRRTFDPFLQRDGDLAPGIVALDDLSEQSEDVRHVNWRRWLVLFNSLQVLPSMLMTTLSGIAGGNCDALVPFSGVNVAAAVSADQLAWSQDWIEAMKDTLQPLQTGMKVLAQMGLPAPVVGHELADQRGNVVADAELAWPDALLVVLRADQADMESIWLEAGWGVLILDATGEKMTDGTEWTAAVGQTISQTTTDQKASQ